MLTATQAHHEAFVSVMSSVHTQIQLAHILPPYSSSSTLEVSCHIANASICTADGRFKEAIGLYEPLVQGHLENLLEVTAIVLANLCVCYIMTSQNDQAEALMRQVERQEEQQALAVSMLS